MPADPAANDAAWAAYYAALQDRPPRYTATFAARRFGAPGHAVDLGCGGGRDVLPLLAQGWTVLGIDQQSAAAETILAKTPAAWRERLTIKQEPFEAADWGMTDLVVSSFSLPLAPKPAFPELWSRIRSSLKPGGRFAGQLYGLRDSWARDGAADGVVAFSREACLELLKGMKIELFEEEEHEGVTPRGKAKHWHIFHIVAKNP